MVLSPEFQFEFEVDDEEVIETSRTFRINLETMELTDEIIDGIEAMKQFVYFATRTPRYAHSIYSEDIGSELEELIADNTVTEEFKKMEIPRLIRESLIYDERINNVFNFKIEHIEDAFHVQYTVDSVEGIFDMEEVF